MSISKYHVSKNLFNPDTRTSNKNLVNGVETSGYTGFYISDYISIVTNNVSINKARSCGWYDENKNVVSYENKSTAIFRNYSKPNNAVYIRLAFNISDISPNDVLVVDGDYTEQTMPPYEPYGNTWNEVGYKKYETATDTITSLPKTIIGDGQPISSYTIKGNMTQSGTPTPSNPIYPTECGDKTANLLYLYKAGYRYDNNGIEVQAASANIYAFNVESGNTYTINAVYNTSVGASTLRIFGLKQGTVTTSIAITNVSELPYTYTVATDIDEIRLSMSTGATNVMANTGTTPLDYEPFGYKIPILSNGVTTNIYLGSTPLAKNGTDVDAIGNNTLYKATNRAVLTGLENYTLQSINQYGIANFYLANVLTGLDVDKAIVCSHGERQTTGISQTTTEGFIANNNGEIYFRINSTTASTVPEFKAWLSEQKPQVTFLYTLATPTTETVTTPTIPTSGTAQTFDVDTTLKPSEVSLTYHGWHEHSDTKFTTP